MFLLKCYRLFYCCNQLIEKSIGSNNGTNKYIKQFILLKLNSCVAGNASVPARTETELQLPAGLEFWYTSSIDQVWSKI